MIIPEVEDVYFDDVGVWGIITSSDAWGDIITSVQPAHLAKIGIKHGNKLYMELGGKRYVHTGKEFKLTYGGNSFLSVDQGEWYAYDHAEGMDKEFCTDLK